MKDKQIESLIKAESKRQKGVINLIASENYASDDVLFALGSELNNKYAEGYAAKRYYGGNEVVDQVENLCKARALKLFKLSPEKWAVNVQPLSGSPANLAVYAALVPLGGKIMGMSLDNGGHLTHGHGVSVTGKFWRQVPYGVDPKTEILNYETLKKLAKKAKPNIIVAGFTAYPRQINFAKFREIADSVKAILMVDMSHTAGLVAAGVHPSPFKYADVVTTTTHKTLRGPRAAMIFSRIAPARQLPFLTPSDPAKRRVASRGEKAIPSLPQLIDRAIFPGLQGGPHMNQIAAVAVALGEANTPAFKKYAKQIIKNTKALADELSRRGWRIVSGGSDTHLALVDTWMGGQGIGGKEASAALEAAGIIVNKNTIPSDTRSPMDPSGIRVGMAAETTRGANEKKSREIARQIDRILKSRIGKVKTSVLA